MITNPFPRSQTLTRDQIRLVLRIYFIDKAIRRKNGFQRCSSGLLQRLAAEFGVKDRLIEDIAAYAGYKRKRGNRFRDINRVTELKYSHRFRKRLYHPKGSAV